MLMPVRGSQTRKRTQINTVSQEHSTSVAFNDVIIHLFIDPLNCCIYLFLYLLDYFGVGL